MSWRTFKFFEQEEMKDPDSSNSFKAVLKLPVSAPASRLRGRSNWDLIYCFPPPQDRGVTCCACGRGQMVFGDILHVMFC